MATSPNKTEINKATQEVMTIKEIRDGVVILKDGGLRIALLVSSINFALKSEPERAAILLQFQNFLNSLDFEIQISVQSRRLDIKPYLRTLDEVLAKQTNDLLKIQTTEYIQFIKEFTNTTEIMAKTFLVIIPYTPAFFRPTQGTFLSKLFPGTKKKSADATAADNFEENRSQLEQRAAVVAQGFSRMDLRVVQLGTEELVELYFKIFNPGETVPTLQ
jgi:hypothetical protein